MFKLHVIGIKIMIMVVCTIILEAYHHFHHRPQLSEAQTPELSIGSSVFQAGAEQKNQQGWLGVKPLAQRCCGAAAVLCPEAAGKGAGRTWGTRGHPILQGLHPPLAFTLCLGFDSGCGEGDALHAQLRRSANALACPSDSVTRLQHPDPSCLALINSV